MIELEEGMIMSKRPEDGIGPTELELAHSIFGEYRVSFSVEPGDVFVDTGVEDGIEDEFEIYLVGATIETISCEIPEDFPTDPTSGDIYLEGKIQNITMRCFLPHHNEVTVRFIALYNPHTTRLYMKIAEQN